MAEKQVRKGNATVFTMSLKKDAVAITDLATATNIDFVLNLSAGAASFALEENGTPTTAKLLIDTPATGDVEMSANSTDMAIAAGIYDLAVQVTYSATNKVEFIVEKAIEVFNDLIT